MRKFTTDDRRIGRPDRIIARLWYASLTLSMAAATDVAAQSSSCPLYLRELRDTVRRCEEFSTASPFPDGTYTANEIEGYRHHFCQHVEWWRETIAEMCSCDMLVEELYEARRQCDSSSPGESCAAEDASRPLAEDCAQREAEERFDAVCRALAAGDHDPYQMGWPIPELVALYSELSGTPEFTDIPVTPSAARRSGASILDLCTGVVSDQSAEERPECARSFAIDEARVVQDGTSCTEVENNRADIYREISRLNKIPDPDEFRDEMVRHLDTLRHRLRDARSDRRGADVGVVAGGG